MGKFDTARIRAYKVYWDLPDNGFSEEQKKELVKVSELLCKRIEANEGVEKGVALYYPEDCNDFSVFVEINSAAKWIIVNKPQGSGFMMRPIT